MTVSPPDWHPDPYGRHQLRYWNGDSWTDHVADGGQTSTDPVSAAPSTSADAERVARDYLAVAPPGARTENLASACILQTCALEVGAAHKMGAPLPYAELAEAERLAEHLLLQDTDIAASVARKIVFNISAMASLSRTETTIGGWYDQVLGANGIVDGTSASLEMAHGLHDPDGTAISAANIFWMTLRAVGLGPSRAAKGEWAFYSSLYTDPERASLAYTVIAWGSVAVARLINSGGVDRSKEPILGDRYRFVPPMTKPGWYPHPRKAGRLPDGDAQFKCFWDGNRWTDRVRLQQSGRWVEQIVSLRSAPDQ